MALSAADLQRRHNLEGAPDPFPSLKEPTSVTPRQSARNGAPNPESEEAFPSLAPAQSANKPAASAWGASAAARIRPAAVKQNLVTDTFTIPTVDLSTAGKDGKPTSLGEIMRQVMSQFKVKVEASTNQKMRQTTFYIKSESAKELDKAKRSLLAGLSPVVSLTVNAPVSTIPSIVGPKGAKLKQIRDQTGVKVDIPRRDANLTPGGSNGHANGQSHSPSRATTPLPATGATVTDEDEEPTVPVTITGPQPLAEEAQAMINEVIASKRARSTQRVGNIPAHILPFLIPRRTTFESAAQGADINLNLNRSAREIAVSGDREAVGRVVESIRSAIDFFTADITPLRLTLPKRQHRLLQGSGADEIMAKAHCAVIVPGPEDSSEEITVWGRGAELGSGVQAVIERANSAYIHEFPLPGPLPVARQLLTYMTRIGYPKTLATANPGVHVYTPPSAVVERGGVLNVDIVGEKPAVDAAVRQVSELLGKLIGGTRDVNIDWLVHRIINSHKNTKKIKGFHDAHNVLVFFPPESAEQSTVLLVYDPTSPSASPSPDEKAKNLDDVEKELLKMARDAADVKAQTISVEKKWHDAVVGKDGTTLNAIIGEDKTLSIKVGAEAGDASTEDVILVRGVSADVDRAVKEILRIVEDAKNDVLVSSYATEFEIDREHVRRIIGAAGAGINKLRDQLGVKVDFFDDVEDKDKDSAKKKKPTSQKSKVKIVGRKENVEEAKKRIVTQAERLADETTEVLKIAHQYHSSLIGQSGKYVIRLEEKYDVKITFPRESESAEGKTREPLKSDEVLIRGGRKGVASAKAELLDAVEFEKESNNVVKFTVPTRSVARILGKAGATINEIKDNTGAQIDVDRAEDASITNISARGTKKAIAEAKAAILEIANQVTEETTETVEVPHKFHRSIIGPGGQGLKDLVSRCGGPADPKAQAGLIRFPRQGETSDEVRLRGEPKLVAKLKVELEQIVATLQDRVVLGVEVPAAQHRALIGRGGQHLNELQDRHKVGVQFPGSRSYNQVGEPENASDLADVDPANIVKVVGSHAAVEKAVEELKGQVKAPAPEGVSATLTIPLKYHHAVTQQGNFFRKLRSFGVQVEQSALPQHPAVPPRPAQQADATAARIDDTESAPAGAEIQWQVVPNYQDAEEGESDWTFKARDQSGLDRALKVTQEAIEHAEKMSHVGFLNLPDRSAFPRIVGAKGANVSRLRDESGADITVSRDDSVIVIVGSETAIETAKEAILKISNNRSRGRRDA
ncbi:hypothetical protein CERSUDRAFT_114510 [Gelatoporia subvermispora B]|uniref:K Homology domain-containing protein n=1 Tax=Ceriporiopsis subvermispora (strain B) TaxID=914234 RepID=M2QLH1_CERS8|nr:hypothetical protein CERSUDRAFT_114510 [Gelatoporia subvermispora B]